MALFGSNKRATFKPTPYGSVRKKRRIPRWLILMLTGVVIGAGGLLFIQKSYAPPTLTTEQAEQLRQDLNSTNLDKQRLQAQVEKQSHDLEEAQANLQRQTDLAAQSQQELTQLKQDVLVLANAIPPDPRGTSPGIRAADFANADKQLKYQVLIMQDKPDAPPFYGKVEFAVAGRYPNGNSTTLDIPADAVKVGHYALIEGNVDLPNAFKASQVTIRVRRSDNGELAATRTIKVSP
jgi:hypothetical protein